MEFILPAPPTAAIMPRYSGIRQPSMSRARIPALALFLLLATGCGNKGPLFLPPPATQQAESATSAPPATPAPITQPATGEPGTTAPPAPTPPAGN